jgi:hypothetical protein
VQALDPRTRMVLFKMLNRGVFNDINGCISTGKEVEKGITGFILFVPVLCCCLNFLSLIRGRQMFIMQQNLMVRN